MIAGLTADVDLSVLGILSSVTIVICKTLTKTAFEGFYRISKVKYRPFNFQLLSRPSLMSEMFSPRTECCFGGCRGLKQLLFISFALVVVICL